MMLCPNCGKNIEDKSKYCLYCGTQIEDNSEPVVVYSVQNQHTDTPPKSFRKWVIAGAIVLVVVLLAGAGWGVVSWKQKEDLRNAIEYEWLGAVDVDGLVIQTQMLHIDEHRIEYGLKSVGFGYTHLITYDWKPINKNTIRVWISPDLYEDYTVEFSEADDGSYIAMEIRPALTSTDSLEIWIQR